MYLLPRSYLSLTVVSSVVKEFSTVALPASFKKEKVSTYSTKLCLHLLTYFIVDIHFKRKLSRNITYIIIIMVTWKPSSLVLNKDEGSVKGSRGIKTKSKITMVIKV